MSRSASTPRLVLQLAGDALGVLSGLVGDLRRLRLRISERLGMHGVRVGEFLRGVGTVGERRAHGVLLLLHHGLHRRHDIAPQDEHDDCEPDQLTNECRHLAAPA